MKNNLNNEERLLRDKLNQAESGFNYQESSWQEMQQLIQKKGFFTQYASIIKAGIGFAFLISAVYLINESWTGNNSTKIAQQETVSNKVEATITNATKIEKEEQANNSQEVQDKLEESNAPIASPIHSNSNPNKETTPIQTNEVNKLEQTTEPNLEKDNGAVTTSLPKEKKTTNPEVILNQIVLGGKSCIGNTMTATANADGKDAKNLTYKWMIDDQEISTKKAQAEFKIEKAGLLQIVVNAYLNGKLVGDTGIEIRIPDVVDIDFTYHDLESPYDDLKAEFKASPDGLSNLKWEIEGIKAELNGLETSYRFDKKGVYNLSLTHTSKYGCISTITKPIAIEHNFKELDYDAFTPDGNNLNESFMPVGFTPEAGIIGNDEFRMSIYDYNGKLVYTTTSNQEPWNGRLNNQGNILAEGAYVWKVELENSKGQQVSYAGKIRIRY